MALIYGQTYKDDYFAMGIDQKSRNVKDYIGEAMNTLALYSKNTSRGLPQNKWKYDMCATNYSSMAYTAGSYSNFSK